MISGAQIKAARMLLNWDLSMLARSASVDDTAVVALEAGSEEPLEVRNLIQETLEAAGVQFPDHDKVTLKQDRQKQ
jgi:predicted nuclease of predicted toxin-antitoxin system